VFCKEPDFKATQKNHETLRERERERDKALSAVIITGVQLSYHLYTQGVGESRQDK
jgi:hypothetical protein